MAAAIVAVSIAAGACTDIGPALALLPMNASEQIATTTAARLAELKDKDPKVLLNNAAGTKEWKLWANAGPGVLVKGSSLITLARRQNPPGNELRQDGVTCPPTHTRVHC